ncbi:MAG: YifB family Mg chelatase-like AAA ATPase [Actinomycetota bacterium]
MLARTMSVAVLGLEGHPVEVEADVANGLPGCRVVGLPDASVQESRDRVRAAVVNAGLTWPDRRMTLNLSPGEIPKMGTAFDLPIALAVLAAGQSLDPEAIRGVWSLAELGLDSRLRPVRGVLTAALAAREAGAGLLLVAPENLAEARLVPGLTCRAVVDLASALALVSRGVGDGEDSAVEAPVSLPAACGLGRSPGGGDLAEVKGQPLAKRALEVAAAGGHNLLLIGPPGAGKTMLARRLPGILPPLEAEEALTVTRVYSAAGLLPPGSSLVTERPFRAPHHSVSLAGMVGGGVGVAMPGQVSLAHCGVLFLDEMAEFPPAVLNALRQPLEEGMVTIVRSRCAVSYPASFALVAATNPCPCGYLGSGVRPCRCEPARAAAYLNRLSGPMLDRIDLHVQVGRVPVAELTAGVVGESSQEVRARVMEVRARQADRAAWAGATTNARVPGSRLDALCRLGPEARRLLSRSVESAVLSARSYDRVRRVARTVADLAGSEVVGEDEVAEALMMRNLDRALGQSGG